MVIGGRITALFLGSCVSQFPVGMERRVPESEVMMVGRYGGRRQEPDTDCSHFFPVHRKQRKPNTVSKIRTSIAFLVFFN